MFPNSINGNNHLIIRLVISGLMIIIGTIIYITSRSDIIFFKWIPESLINIFRCNIINSNSKLGYLIVYCFPDGLWYGALLLVQRTFLSKSCKSRSIYWISITLPFILELIQIHTSIPGTFDPLDIGVYFIIAIFFIRY